MCMVKSVLRVTLVAVLACIGVASEMSAAGATYYEETHVVVKNLTPYKMKFSFQYVTKSGQDGDPVWLPADPESGISYEVTLPPLQETALMVDGKKILASYLRFWAECERGKLDVTEMWLVPVVDGKRRYGSDEGPRSSIIVIPFNKKQRWLESK
jgi:hypothetical protein